MARPPAPGHAGQRHRRRLRRFRLPVEEMGEKLVEFARSFEPARRAWWRRARQPARSDDRRAPQEIYAILRNQVGHDFSGYKEQDLPAPRRSGACRCSQIARPRSLRRAAAAGPQEVNELFRDLLIGVTNFFRDADAFEALSTMVIPKLFEGKGADDTVRIWVPGCATGEEVYSIAILLREHMDELRRVPTRADLRHRHRRAALERGARRRAIRRRCCDGVSPERLRALLHPATAAATSVSKEVRDLCIFSSHSVIRDPPFSRID